MIFTSVHAKSLERHAMDKTETPTSRGFSEMAQRLHNRNERYLEFLKQSGDPGDMRSKVLATIIDSVADGLIVLDDKLTIVMANLAAAELANWQIEDMTRDELRRQYKFFTDEGRTPLAHDQEPIVVATRERRPHETIGYVTSEHLPAPGRWVRSHAAPIFDEKDKLLGGVTVFTDITERVRLQRQRDCLAALITHDIKNHLAAEQMFLDDLCESQDFDPEDKEIISNLQASSGKFRRIAESLLELFHLNVFGDKQSVQPVDLVSTLKKAIELSVLEATNRRVHVDEQFGEGHPVVRALPGAIFHVFHNLIQNAIEASSIDTAVSVVVSSTANAITVSIIDSGAGMSTEEIALLFSPPGMTGKTYRSATSSGFGLYLSHMLIDGQGGSLTCTSKQGEGTTVTVVLPAG
jgi:PAS domain S-box-containing protein